MDDYSKVNKKTQAIYLPKSSTNIKLDYNYRELYSLFSYYDKNSDLELDSSEIETLKHDMQTCTQNGKALNVTKLAKLLKSSGNLVKDFIYRIDGNLIGNEIKSALGNKISWFNKPERAESLIYKINPSNVNQVNYTFTDVHKSKSLAETVLEKFDYQKAKKMLAHIANVSSQALAQNGVSSETILNKFNNAMEKNDKTNMLKYLQMLTNMLNYRDIQHLDIANKYELKPSQALSKTNKESLKELNNYSDNKDIVGDGKLANTTTHAQTKTTEKILSAVNKMLQEPVFKEIASSCVSKEKNYLCTFIPKSKTTYKYNENEMAILMKKYKTPVGDGDMSNFVFAILVEAKNQNFDINSATPQKLQQFIKNLFFI